jgi:hypothetical protein
VTSEAPERRLFSVSEARAEMPRVLAEADEVIQLRADLVAASVRQRDGEPVDLPAMKADEARLSEILDGFVAAGYEVKGFAPLLLDFPSVRDGRDVLLCWLEGESDIEWYHDAEHGFAGRRRLDD